MNGQFEWCLKSRSHGQYALPFCPQLQMARYRLRHSQQCHGLRRQLFSFLSAEQVSCYILRTLLCLRVTLWSVCTARNVPRQFSLRVSCVSIIFSFNNANDAMGHATIRIMRQRSLVDFWRRHPYEVRCVPNLSFHIWRDVETVNCLLVRTKVSNLLELRYGTFLFLV
jgi:hypothetical protein